MPERKEVLSEGRYPYFAIVGGVGVGKTELTSLLERTFGLPAFREEFVGNPHLEAYYRKDPRDHAFNSQMFFLAEEARQMRPLKSRLLETPVAHDQYLEGDAFFETLLWSRMQFISDADHRAYRACYRSLMKGSFLPKADVFVAVTASPDTSVRRIVERGREMELVMNERFPEYFPTITKGFNTWFRLLAKRHPVIVIDTDRWDFMNSQNARESVVGEFQNWSGYYLSSPNQLGLRGRDGSKLKLPDFLRPRGQAFIDVSPSLSSEQKMLRRR